MDMTARVRNSKMALKGLDDAFLFLFLFEVSNVSIGLFLLGLDVMSMFEFEFGFVFAFLVQQSNVKFMQCKCLICMSKLRDRGRIEFDDEFVLECEFELYEGIIVLSLMMCFFIRSEWMINGQ